MRLARAIAANWLIAAAQVSMQLGTTACVTFRELAIELLPKPEPTVKKPRAPNWWREMDQVRGNEND